MNSEHLSSEATAQVFDQFVIPNYRRYPVNLVRGSGSKIWDSEGREYLDFFPGWGCNLLGHCPPRVVEAVQRQVAELIHVPNTWHMESQGRWAQMLVERSFDAQAFFCNSGAEANEAAIKLARLHQGAERYKIITFHGSFHGRTFGALAATAQPAYHEGLGPMVAGFTYCPYGSLAEVEKRIDDATGAIMLEPIQGEGGVVIPDRSYLQGLRELADRHNLLLIFDEVQTGCGRTGHWFAHQYFDVTPDIMTLAKSLCGGIAGGAMLARREIAPSLRPGMHASTFGGNPIAAVAGIAMLETVEAEGLLERTKENAEVFARHLAELQSQCSLIREVRQAGLMIGIELEFEGAAVVARCLDAGLLINCTQGNVIRLLPAMNVTEKQVIQGMEILRDAIMAVSQEHGASLEATVIGAAESDAAETLENANYDASDPQLDVEDDSDDQLEPNDAPDASNASGELETEVDDLAEIDVDPAELVAMEDDAEDHVDDHDEIKTKLRDNLAPVDQDGSTQV